MRNISTTSLLDRSGWVDERVHSAEKKIQGAGLTYKKRMQILKIFTLEWLTRGPIPDNEKYQQGKS